MEPVGSWQVLTRILDIVSLCPVRPEALMSQFQSFGSSCCLFWFWFLVLELELQMAVGVGTRARVL